MRDIVAAVTSGCADGTPFLDLNSYERGLDSPELCCACLPSTIVDKSELVDDDATPSEPQIALLHFDRAKVATDDLQPMLDLAIEGCRNVGALMRQLLRQHAETTLGLSLSKP